MAPTAPTALTERQAGLQDRWDRKAQPVLRDSSDLAASRATPARKDLRESGETPGHRAQWGHGDRQDPRANLARLGRSARKDPRER